MSSVVTQTWSNALVCMCVVKSGDSDGHGGCGGVGGGIGGGLGSVDGGIGVGGGVLADIRRERCTEVIFVVAGVCVGVW
jgi:hypothetical protein